MAMVSLKSGKDGEEAATAMAKMYGPGQVDQTIRQAIHVCWMSLPPKRKNVKVLE